MRTQASRGQPAPPLATSSDVAAVAAAARAAGRLGIDTEFMSEGRYRALLCLVQIAVDDPEPAGNDHGGNEHGGTSTVATTTPAATTRRAPS